MMRDITMTVPGEYIHAVEIPGPLFEKRCRAACVSPGQGKFTIKESTGLAT